MESAEEFLLFQKATKDQDRAKAKERTAEKRLLLV
jgi:hypothetical protein